MLKLPHNCTHLTSKVMLKVLQVMVQQHVNHELPDVQAGFRKSRGTRDQIVNICWIIEKAREFQKSIYFCFIGYAKAFDCVDHDTLWKILKKMGIPDRLTCLLRELYAGQEATVKTGQETTDWFQIGKGVHQGCILSPCLFKVKVKLLSRARLFATPWIVASTKLLGPWDFQGKSTGVGCHFFLQGIFPTQGSNPGLSHRGQTLYRLSHQGRVSTYIQSTL